jgi:hypothetical protein
MRWSFFSFDHRAENCHSAFPPVLHRGHHASRRDNLSPPAIIAISLRDAEAVCPRSVGVQGTRKFGREFCRHFI